jgi:hypothetical protein
VGILDVPGYSRAQSDALYGRALLNPDDVGYDIIIVAGQSNATGSGAVGAETNYLDPKDSRVFQWPGNGVNVGNIVAGFDPLFHHTGSYSVGPGMPFARGYAKTVPNNRSVLLVPTARGATSFTQVTDVGVSYSWDPANTTAQVNLYNFTVAQTDGALAAAGANSRVSAILWMQGEGDANFMTQVQYAAKLDALIDGLRTRYGANIPVIIGQVVPESLLNSGIRGINAAHIDTPRRKVLTAFAYGPTNSYNPDVPPIHYSTPGQRKLGSSFFEAFNRFAKVNVLGVAPVAPGTVSLTQSGTSVDASWVRTPGRVTDYKVEQNIAGAGWITLTRPQSIELSASIVGLTLGDTVQVRVSASNEEGTSAPSSATSLTLVTLPAQVTGLTAGTSTPYSQPLTWNAAARASTYKIEYKTTAGSSWTAIPAAISGLSYTVTALSASTAYDFRVSATNSGGAGAVSSTTSNTTQAFSALRAAVTVASSGAFSIRKLDTAYTGNCMKVRRSSDNTTADIGFVASGDIDSTALLAFAGSGSAYVDTWYDQSGSAINVSQATTAKQPRIVNAGVLDTINGRATVVFDGAGQSLVGPGAMPFATGLTLLSVAETRAHTGEQSIYSEVGATQARYAPVVQFASALTRGAVVFNDTPTGISSGGGALAFPTGLSLAGFVDYGLTAKNITNGVAGSAITMLNPRGTGTLGNRYIGTRGVGVTGQLGAISEVVVYYTQPTDAQRQAGEANEKAYFSTP